VIIDYIALGMLNYCYDFSNFTLHESTIVRHMSDYIESDKGTNEYN